MTFTIAVANEKGGVAKTTTTLSLGGALSEAGQKVLVVDLDPQANLTLALGQKLNGSTGSLVDMLMGSKRADQLTRETGVERLDLIPSNHQLTIAERFLGVREDPERLLREKLEDASGFDFVLLDCPPTLGFATRNALVASDLLIIPTQSEFFSAGALKHVLEVIRELRASSNPKLRYRLLVTMLDRRNRIHRTLYKQIRSAFQGAVFETVIEIDTRLRESPIFGQPITIYAPDSRGAAQYRDLAKELIGYVAQTSR